MSTPDATDRDVATGLAVRAATQTLAVLAGAVLVIGAIGVAALAMAQAEQDDSAARLLLPGATTLMLGQAAALVGALLAGLVLGSLLRGRVPHPPIAISRLSTALGLCVRIMLAASVLAVLIWTVIRTDAALPALLGGVVSLQVAVVIGVLRERVLLRAHGAQPPAA